MGEGASNFDHGSVLIQTDQPYYVAGPVTGKVYLDLHSTYPAKKLKLKIKGKEKCKWLDTVHVH